MLIRFPSEKFNFLKKNKKSYFLVRSNVGKWLLIDSKCPHRGGPLHLGRVDDGYIVCPWHRNRVSKIELGKNSLPMVVVNKHIKVFFQNMDGPVTLLKTNCAVENFSNEV